MIEWGVLLGAALAVVVLALRTLLPHLFTSDDDVVRLAAFLLVWVALLQPVAGVTFVLDGLLIGAGDQRFLAWAMVGATAVFAVAAGGVAAAGLGIGWLWAAIGVFMVARAGALLWRFVSNRWLVLGARV
jgi:Na+-driven multidrug efflux pump